MPIRHPSLHLLKIFEAAARHQSFKQAAEELYLTPSAVSHQIKTLEQTLEIALFQRRNRAIRLTPAGRAYFGVVGEALNRIRRGTEDLGRRFGQPTLRISLMPSLAARHVIPNLHRLQTRLSGVELRIETSYRLVDFRHDEIDLALRYGRGPWPDAHAERLLDVDATVVCAPHLLEGRGQPGLELLNELPLVGLSEMPDAWPRWARAAGLKSFEPSQEIFFGSYEDTLAAAQEGLGLALALFPLETPLVTSGQLAAPLPVRLPQPDGVYLVCRKGEESRSDFDLFRAWFLELFK
jgi:LysR family glycine cleavage system transcriptional activator